MRPVVGVMPLWDDEKQSIWMLPEYLDGLREAGCCPVIFPLTDEADLLRQLMAGVDGVLFTGGHDVAPALYGETPINDTVVCCPLRDAMETVVLESALAQRKPILAFCRGLQFINASLGGKLYQHLPLQQPEGLGHSQKKPYSVPSHTVTLLPGTPLQQLLGTDTIAVNSTHHQAVRVTGAGLAPMATAPDGIIEAVYRPDYPFLWALQWHPELLYKTDAASRRIFEAFAASMRRG